MTGGKRIEPDPLAVSAFANALRDMRATPHGNADHQIRMGHELVVQGTVTERHRRPGDHISATVFTPMKSQRLLMGAMPDRTSVEARAAELAQSAHSPVTRAYAFGLLGDLARSRNQRDQALAQLEVAARIVIPEPAPLLRLADLLNTEIWARGVPLLELARDPSLDPFQRDEEARHAVDLCLQRIPTVVFGHEQGSATISDAQLDAALIYLITLRASRGHDAELRPWLIRVRERIAARLWTLPSVLSRIEPLLQTLP